MLRFPDDRKKLKMPQMTPIEAPRGVAPKQDPSVTERIGDYAIDKSGNYLADKAILKAQNFFTPQVIPIAQAGTGMSPGMAQAIIGSGSQAAPLVTAQAGAPMSIAMKGGLPAMAEAGLATGATGLGSMATAAMASPLAPIVGGLALAKMLGFFSKGGQVGPLGQVDKNEIADKILKDLEEQSKNKEKSKENNFLLPSFKSIGGPISKIEYKSAGGETYKLSYGGGPLNKGE